MHRAYTLLVGMVGTALVPSTAFAQASPPVAPVRPRSWWGHPGDGAELFGTGQWHGSQRVEAVDRARLYRGLPQGRLSARRKCAAAVHLANSFPDRYGMGPNTRTVGHVTLEDAVAVSRYFGKLMGDAVKPRRLFIKRNGRYKSSLDV